MKIEKMLEIHDELNGNIPKGLFKLMLESANLEGQRQAVGEIYSIKSNNPNQ